MTHVTVQQIMTKKGVFFVLEKKYHKWDPTKQVSSKLVCKGDWNKVSDFVEERYNVRPPV